MEARRSIYGEILKLIHVGDLNMNYAHQDLHLLQIVFVRLEVSFDSRMQTVTSAANRRHAYKIDEPFVDGTVVTNQK